MVVNQLAERSLPIVDVSSSNPHLFTVLKMKIK